MAIAAIYKVAALDQPQSIYIYININNRHFGYPETKINDFEISGTRLGTTLRHCRLILETDTEPGTKSRFHYLCCGATACHGR